MEFGHPVRNHSFDSYVRDFHSNKLEYVIDTRLFELRFCPIHILSNLTFFCQTNIFNETQITLVQMGIIISYNNDLTNSFFFGQKI